MVGQRTVRVVGWRRRMVAIITVLRRALKVAATSTGGLSSEGGARKQIAAAHPSVASSATPHRWSRIAPKPLT
jgi:hypothetical protein